MPWQNNIKYTEPCQRSQFGWDGTGKGIIVEIEPH